MNNMIKKILLSDRKLFLLIAALVAVVIFTIITSIYANNIERKNDKLKSQITEIQSLSKGLFRIKNIVESKEKKIVPTIRGRATSVVSTLEQILDKLGLEADVIRPLEKKRIQGSIIEEDAALEIKGIDLNSIVNLLYKIDNSPVPMKIKNAEIETTFENPDTFVLNVTVTLIRKA